MAIVERNSSSTNRADRPESISIDPLAPGLELGEKVEVDKSADAWEFLPPPPTGRYTLAIHPSDNPYTKNYSEWDKEGNPVESSLYYSANCEVRVQSDNKDTNGAAGYTTFTTRRARGKRISTMEGFIVKCGFGKYIKDEMAPGEVVQIFAKLMLKEPTLDALVDWRGSYQGEDGKYVNVFNTMTDFPQNPDGTYKHQCTVPVRGGGRKEIRAQFNVKEWYGKGEGVKGAAAGATAASNDAKPLRRREAGTTATAVSAKAVNATPKPQPQQTQSPSLEDLDTTGDDGAEMVTDQQGGDADDLMLE